MPEIYVTIFDSLFLPQGLALYHSLLKHGGSFHLFVLCMDQECSEILSSLGLKNLYLLNLEELENDALLAVKPGRNRAEYCWTLTPWAIQWALDAAPGASRVTYLDADTFFLQSPETIFLDLDKSGKSFLITEHAYSPFFDQTALSGRFCVQFIPVLRGRGELILHWWRDRCIEWCFARFEDGKFGDQKYIEELSISFADDVLAIKNDPRFLAPWNADIYRYSDAVIYHFQGLRILNRQSFLLCDGYHLPKPLLSYVYSPYVQLVRSFENRYKRSGLILRPQVRLSFKKRLKYTIALIFRPVFNFMEIYNQKIFLSKF